jgi:hypothetical protein
MKHAFLNRSIDDRHRLSEHRLRFLAASSVDCCAQLLDLSTQGAAIPAVYFIAPLGLSYPFFG